MRMSLIAALGLLLALSGCNTTGRNGGSTSEATSGNTLVQVLVAEPSTFDPAKIQDLTTSEMLQHVYESLVRYNERNEVEPALAEKWDISPDGKTYTFHIRQGVKFHNGRLLEAADFKYSWERALDPNTASTVAANYLDGILGVKEAAAGTRKDLPGVEVIDKQTLKITIDKPRSYFLGMLSYPTGSVVCKEAIEKNGGVLDQRAMIGTGPFMLDSYQVGQRVILKANPNYWGGKPKLDRIEFPVFINPVTAYNNFETNKAGIYPDVPAVQYAQDKAKNRLQAEYQILPAASFSYLVMHPGVRKEFTDAHVRQAFAAAIDRQKILQVAYQGTGTLADGVLPPELPGAGKPPTMPGYDPAKAKQLLAQAGYPGGKGFPELTLNILQANPAVSAAAQVIRTNLQDNLGISVTIQEREAAQFWDDTSKNKYDFFLTGWIADYPDPQDFISALFVSNAPINRVGYSNPKFDALCNQADAEPDMSKRAELYSQANQILMDDVGVLPISFRPRIVLIHTNVKDWRANLCQLLPNTQTTVSR